MEEQLVSFETAKLAKEKGFKVGSDMKWSDNVEGQKPVLCSFQEGVNGIYSALFINSEKSYHTYEAPTQSLLQKWLREKHGIHLWVYYCMILESSFYQIRQEISKNEYYHFTNENNSNKMHEFNYEKALEVGLQEAFKLIK